MEVVIATRNPHKAQEVKSILREFGIEGHSLDDIDPAGKIPRIQETGSTLKDNALIKARTVHSVTGNPVIADDTGLEVDALHGAPGVLSARYAGEGSTYQDNMDKLLQALKHVPPERRTARFRTVACYVDGESDSPGQEELCAEGVVEGVIRSEPAGDGGFGYDPVFTIPELGRTYAQLSEKEKNRLSHRSKALRKLVNLLHRDSVPTPHSSHQT
ncbi:MAG: RdgB/HAM1 family non-canonical purine NTP pyrophosphatase [Fidelibacterota bacterium]